MTAARSTREEHRYRGIRRKAGEQDCPFCTITEGDEQFVGEQAGLKVIRNIYPYSLWDGQGVVDHLLIVPTHHTDTLGDLSPETAVEFMKLINQYEAEGYNLYARAPASTMKSIVHQHTHLIKLDGKHRKVVFSLQRPFYLRVSR